MMSHRELRRFIANEDLRDLISDYAKTTRCFFYGTEASFSDVQDLIFNKVITAASCKHVSESWMPTEYAYCPHCGVRIQIHEFKQVLREPFTQLAEYEILRYRDTDCRLLVRQELNLVLLAVDGFFMEPGNLMLSEADSEDKRDFLRLISYLGLEIEISDLSWNIYDI